MKKIDISSLEYVFIFDYYDEPLFFISKDEETKEYYAFYMIDDANFFFSAIGRQEIDYLFEGHSSKEFLIFLQEERLLNILSLEGENQQIITLKEGEQKLGDTISNFFPVTDYPIEYDFLSKKNFEEIKDYYRESFPEYYEIKDMSVHIVNEKNDNSLAANIIIDTITFIKKAIDDIKKDSAANQILAISSFSPGSFNINFELEDPKNVSLFPDDEVYFDEIIEFLNKIGKPNNKLGDSCILKRDILEYKSIVEATKDFYSTIDEENLKVEFLSERIPLARIRKSEIVDNNLTNMISKIRDMEKTLEVKQKTFSVDGEVLSASKSRNGFRIKTSLLGEISGKFETSLFKKIKNSEEQITVSKTIKAEIVEIRESQPDFGYEKTKYVMNSFTQ